MLGVIDDVARRVPLRLHRGDGDAIVLLGETRDEFGGSEWAHVVHGHLGGRPPAVDLDAERRLARLLAAAAADGFAHRRARPVRRRAGPGAGRVAAWSAGAARPIDLPPTLDPFVALFAESAGRVLVTVPPDRVVPLLVSAAASNVPAHPLGTTGGHALAIGGIPALPWPSCARPGPAPCPRCSTPRMSRLTGATPGGRGAVRPATVRLAGRRAAQPDRAVLRAAVKQSLAALAERRAGAQRRGAGCRRSGRCSACSGPRHTRGTPPNTVEADARTWLALVTGRLGWADALRTGRLTASGSRAGEVAALLPLPQAGNEPGHGRYGAPGPTSRRRAERRSQSARRRRTACLC